MPIRYTSDPDEFTRFLRQLLGRAHHATVSRDVIDALVTALQEARDLGTEYGLGFNSLSVVINGTRYYVSYNYWPRVGGQLSVLVRRGSRQGDPVLVFGPQATSGDVRHAIHDLKTEEACRYHPATTGANA